MTTLDDLARVERELRCMADALGYSAGDWIRGNAGTIAEYIAAQRERDADNAKLRAELAALREKARLWDAVGSGKVHLRTCTEGYWAWFGDGTNASLVTHTYSTAAEAVQAAIDAGALK